jgi:hypothetical protein
MNKMRGYDDGDPVRIVVPFSTSNGRRYEVGWTGQIFPFNTTLQQCRESDRYEINLDDDESGRDRGLVVAQSAYFESAAESRRERELRQGDRVRLTADHEGSKGTHAAGTTGTVLTTHIMPGTIQHDIALDFLENIRVAVDQLERIPEPPATVSFAADGSVHVKFS